MLIMLVLFRLRLVMFLGDIMMDLLARIFIKNL